jgi:hypothetical protein
MIAEVPPTDLLLVNGGDGDSRLLKFKATEDPDEPPTSFLVGNSSSFNN